MKSIWNRLFVENSSVLLRKFGPDSRYELGVLAKFGKGYERNDSVLLRSRCVSGLKVRRKSSLSASLCPSIIASRTSGSSVKSRNVLLRSCKLSLAIGQRCIFAKVIFLNLKNKTMPKNRSIVPRVLNDMRVKLAEMFDDNFRRQGFFGDKWTPKRCSQKVAARQF